MRYGVSTLFVAVVVILVLAASALNLYYPSRVASFFSHALQEQGVRERVAILGTTYAVDEGVVHDENGALVTGRASLPIVKLAYAKALARRNPIMALPGSDVTSMRQAIDRLDELRQRLGALQETPEDRTAVTEALYPIHFLRAITDSEEARLAFLASGTEEAWQIHKSAQLIALVAYKEDLERHRAAFTRVVPHTSRRFAAGDSSVDFASVLETIDSLEQAIEETHARWLAREMCLQGRTPACAAGDIRLPHITEHAQVTERVNLQLARSIIKALKRPVPGVASSFSPVYAFPRGECTSRNAAPALFTVKKLVSPVVGISYRRVSFVGDLPLIHSIEYRSVPFYAYFAERSVEYIPTDPLLHYVCPEFWQDMSATFAAAEVGLFASSSPLSAYIETKNVEKVRALEKSLNRTIDPVYIDDVLTYTSLLEQFAKTDEVGAAYRESIEDLLVKFSYASIGVSDTMLAVIEKEEANMRILEKGVPVDLDAPYTFFFRSALPFMFMNINPSVVGFATAPSTTLPPATRDPYMYFSEFIHDPRIMENILHDIRIYSEVHIQKSGESLDALFDSP